MDKVIDELMYRSWKAQIELYGVSFESARKIYIDWQLYEQIYKEEVNV